VQTYALTYLRYEATLRQLEAELTKVTAKLANLEEHYDALEKDLAESQPWRMP
jgi:multidrug resistance efflux pump